MRALNDEGMEETIFTDENIEPGDTVSMRVLAEGKVEINVLPRLQLAEAMERYWIDGPVDIVADRLLWQETAAADVHGRSDG